MTLGLAFCIVMLVWLVFGWWSRPEGGGLKSVGGNIIIFILFVLIGWQIWGPLLHR